MAPNVENDPDLLRKAAQNKTGHVRDRLNSVLSTLEASLAGRGRPWGDDKIGHQFFDGDNGYGIGREHATKNVRNASTSFDNFEKGQVTSAGMLKTMDHGNAQNYR
ncbi:hypothetical protein [Nocardia sp. NPDC049149]|uniref:hypothetical protein n=1 Tax=Nocardia sp. NPDC049149 TaxID=3364315 RepID=UPI00371AB2EA